ncbi:hypothetical protein SAY87_016407 [Trapa incisa]|uniref:Beta-galactosidase n=1 Tax=Trapa incisa TaxID=236973 RepID=A0AAN7QXH0_9MYRT|nr:hypothetical protein SAY87_016407 [Trapa incisa]
MGMPFIPVLLFSFLCMWVGTSGGANVTYDHRSLIIDGQRKLVISASIHYPRSVPEMWPGLIQTAKEGGADAIESYVFWNGHEPSQGNYYFDGRYDLIKFVKIVQQAKMYMILRIGPFVAAEWFYGGIPIWLHYVPGTIFRTDNEPFKYHMQKFTTFIVNLMKKEKLFASQGGPIILAQIENEYGNYEFSYGSGAKPYAIWAATMAVSQNIGVPWIMCQQPDAPDPVINTCNSFYCDQFTPNSPKKPKFWTENWPGWFKTFGSRDPHRPVEDVAFAVARFFQKGGSLNNYYMYHGGTNFDRTNGGPFITTSYDYEAPIDEYGLPRLPKWSHLKELHQAIKLCEKPLLNGEAINLYIGPSLEADVYTDSSGACAAFLANTDDKEDKMIEFRNRTYNIPAWSVSILPDCKNVVLNTAMVKSQSSIVSMKSEALMPSASTSEKQGPKALKWEVFVEKAGIWGKPDFIQNGLADHINTTKYTTDYLWYTTRLILLLISSCMWLYIILEIATNYLQMFCRVFVDENEQFLKNGKQPTLLVESKGHALHAFVNQQLQGSASGSGSKSAFNFSQPISLKAGENEIALLSMTVGLQNAGPFYESWGAGLSSVKIKGFKAGILDLSSSNWTYKIGLEGESLRIYKGEGLNNPRWVPTSEPPKDQPLTWYKAIVDAPSGNEPVGLDMIHMGKGLAWLNGESIGIYFPVKSSEHDVCVKECNYRGTFSPDKCSDGCGEPTQRWYHVPRSWFKPSGNVLVILEEKGADPTKIKISKRKTETICSSVAEDYPSMDIESWITEGDVSSKEKGAEVHLKCPENTKINAVNFASFGNPAGSCGAYSLGSCHYPASMSVIVNVCLNKNECRVEIAREDFSKELCPGTTKKLTVEAVCG